MTETRDGEFSLMIREDAGPDVINQYRKIFKVRCYFVFVFRLMSVDSKFRATHLAAAALAGALASISLLSAYNHLSKRRRTEQVKQDAADAVAKSVIKSVSLHPVSMSGDSVRMTSYL